MNIRKFQPADQQAARGLILNGLGEHFDEIKPDLNPDLDNIYAYYVVPGDLFVVVEESGSLIGTGALIKEDECTGRIVRVSVANSHRRKGIGRQITNYLVSKASEFGYERVVVETNEEWSSAIQLYMSCGFLEVDRHHGEVHLSLKLVSKG